MADFEAFDWKFTSRELTALGGLALIKRMIDGLWLPSPIQSWDLHAPGFNRGCEPVQFIEQMVVNIWCGGARFCHPDITRLGHDS